MELSEFDLPAMAGMIDRQRCPSLERGNMQHKLKRIGVALAASVSLLMGVASLGVPAQASVPIVAAPVKPKKVPPTSDLKLTPAKKVDPMFTKGKEPKVVPSRQVTTNAIACTGTCRQYAYTVDEVSTSYPTANTGAEGAAITMENISSPIPYVTADNEFSIAEFVALRIDQDTFVGVMIGKGQMPGSGTRLAVEYAVNGVYNGGNGTNSGALAVSGANYALGDQISGTHTFDWTYFNQPGVTEGWWLAIDNVYTIVYPKTLWGGVIFNRVDYVHAYGETFPKQLPSITGMGLGGNSRLAGPGQGARMSGYSLYFPPSGVTPDLDENTSANTATDRYRVEIDTNGQGFHYGGPGGVRQLNATTSANNLSGVGYPLTDPNGYGAIGLYSNTSGGVPTTRLWETDSAANAAGVCIPNLGKADGGTFEGDTKVIGNTSKVKWLWFRDSSCAGASMNIDHTGASQASMVNVLPAGWTSLNNASMWRTTTRATCWITTIPDNC